ncbi:MAG: helix-turn-helix transcriptional regulator [Anaerolineae bacterium]|nr:helix-turn-helix transcriptional regulator [Anaerolineae bacterium]
MMDNTVKQFKALANKNRLAIFEYLRGQAYQMDGPPEGSNVGEIAEQFDLALSTVSHHLRTLHEAELIRCEQRGQQTFCVINWEAVEQLRGFLKEE